MSSHTLYKPNTLHASLLCTFLSDRLLAEGENVARLSATFRFMCISTVATSKLMRCEGVYFSAEAKPFTGLKLNKTSINVWIHINMFDKKSTLRSLDSF